jgi:hypothetical protein
LLIRGRGDVFAAVNGFFYASIYLVFMKVSEAPALGARIRALTQSCDTGEFGAAVTDAISGSGVYRTSNLLVAVFYIVFSFYAVKMQRGLYGFGLFRGVLAAALGMLLLSIMVVLIQEPAIYGLVCGYASLGSLAHD